MKMCCYDNIYILIIQSRNMNPIQRSTPANNLINLKGINTFLLTLFTLALLLQQSNCVDKAEIYPLADEYF